MPNATSPSTTAQGDDAGGDRRGRQSASVLVVRKGGGSSLDNDRLCYIKVDDNSDPLLELGRLLPLSGPI